MMFSNNHWYLFARGYSSNGIFNLETRVNSNSNKMSKALASPKEKFPPKFPSVRPNDHIRPRLSSFWRSGCPNKKIRNVLVTSLDCRGEFRPSSYQSCFPWVCVCANYSRTKVPKIVTVWAFVCERKSNHQVNI